MSTIPSTRRLFSPDNRTFFYPIALNAVRILVRIVFLSAGNRLEPLGFSSSIIRLCPTCGPVLRTFFGENLGFLLCPQLCTSATYRNLSITTGISGWSFSQASEFLSPSRLPITPCPHVCFHSYRSSWLLWTHEENHKQFNNLFKNVACSERICLFEKVLSFRQALIFYNIHISLSTEIHKKYPGAQLQGM